MLPIVKSIMSNIITLIKKDVIKKVKNGEQKTLIAPNSIEKIIKIKYLPTQ